MSGMGGAKLVGETLRNSMEIAERDATDRRLTEPAGQAALREHFATGSLAMKEKRPADAIKTFTAAIMMTSVALPARVMDLAVTDRLPPGNALRERYGLFYSARAAAHQMNNDAMSAMEDAYSAYFLVPNRWLSMVQVGKHAAKLCKQPMVPLPFFKRSPPPSKTKRGKDALPFHDDVAFAANEQLCHGLVADVYSMLAEDIDDANIDKRKQAIKDRDTHAALSNAALHPLGPASAAGVSAAAKDREDIRLRTFTATLQTPVDADKKTPQVALLGRLVTNIVAFRLGCRGVNPFTWRPTEMLDKLSKDRLIETWYREISAGWQPPAHDAAACSAPLPDGEPPTGGAFEVGQGVILVNMEDLDKPYLNGVRGRVWKAEEDDEALWVEMVYDVLLEGYESMGIALGSKNLVLDEDAPAKLTKAQTEAFIKGEDVHAVRT